MQKQVFCRWAPSLGELEDTALNVWGTPPYDPKKHVNEPVVFFGLYGLPDFYELWRHKGKKYIFWAGSDIRHFRMGYWLEDKEEGIRICRDGLAQWINKHCENWVENEGEAWQLNDCGIKVTGIQPSFLGNVKDYKISFKKGNKVYLSGHEGSQREYGWDLVDSIACALPEIEFHLYGASWDTQTVKNVIVHGKVPKEQMNKEIKRMQCGLRLNKHDGFSEITAKSILWGQYPITYLYHPHIKQYVTDNCGRPWCVKGLNNLIKLLKEIPKKTRPNINAREWYIKNLNKFPWNQNANRNL